jgi:hypothetical protein
VDREAVARAGRRAQAVEALAFERVRESALREQIAALVLEEEGARIDQAAFAELSEDDAGRVRAALGEFAAEPETEDELLDAGIFVSFDLDVDEEPEVDEIARLEAEADDSRRTQEALERYLAALDRPAVPETG